MIAAPVVDLLRGPPSDHHRTARPGLVEELLAEPGRLERLPVRREPVPVVQPAEVVAAGVVRSVVGARDVAVERHRHVEHG
jgi:hypothetical protein